MEPIEVDPQITRLRWNGKTYRVLSIQERWRFVGKWWITGAPQTRMYYRIEVQCGRSESITMEIFSADEEWVLSRVLD